MTDAIAHRGPDGEGQWIEGAVGLGHRRLAIIDLSPAGHQPMISADHRYVISYNGEIYNFRELRTELEAAGFWFRSRTDTEVVLHALAHWGAEALLRFNGMFALALWDRKERRLLLARDRYGIKPLYVSQQGTRFAFASEQKAILAHPEFRRELDKPALLEYFTFQNIFTDRTLLKDVQLLPARPLRHARPCGNQSAGLVREQLLGLPLPRADRHARRKQEYRRRARSPVPPGRQSPAGQRRRARRLPQRRHGFRLNHRRRSRSFPYLKTFTCGFDLSSASGIELGFDERAKAEAMSARFKTEHYEMVLKAGDMERVLPSFGLASRGAARRPELSELLRGQAGQQVCQGRAVRRRRRRAVRRLSLALLPGRR